MKKIIFTLSILLCFVTICHAQCEEQIKKFYTSYLSTRLYDVTKGKPLLKKSLTEEMLAKFQRMSNATGADPFSRAQDMTDDGINTVHVKSLGDNWYMVSYLWDKNDSTTITEIPLKAHDIDGHCKITYLTNEWYDSTYGDNLLSYEFKSPKTIDHSSATTFLESFYKAYVSIYCAMSKNLIPELASLRSEYLSKNAIKQFKDAEQDNLDYTHEGYDLLINTFDFDSRAYKSLQFTRLNDSDYKITYSIGKYNCNIIVSIKRENNKYVIDRFIPLKNSFTPIHGGD